MPHRTKQIGVRLTAEEASFLAQLKIENAATPSDKLRAIIDEARRRKLGTEDYGASLRLVEELVAPTMRIIRASENQIGMHSELVNRVGDWLSESVAYLIASNGNRVDLDEDRLRAIEESLAKRVFVLIQSVLQLAVTTQTPLYNANSVQDRVDPVLELADVIRMHRAQAQS